MVTLHTIAGGEITTLNHEVFDDPVERAGLETEAFLSGSQLTEVLRSLIAISVPCYLEAGGVVAPLARFCRTDP